MMRMPIFVTACDGACFRKYNQYSSNCVTLSMGAWNDQTGLGVGIFRELMLLQQPPDLGMII